MLALAAGGAVLNALPAAARKRRSHVMADSALSPALGLFERLISRSWWVILLRGLAALAFGAIAFAWPGISLLALIFVYGVYAMADGITAVAAAFTSAQGSQRVWCILGGVVSIAAGVVAFGWPGLTGITLVIVIGAWSIVRGITEIAAGISLRKVIPNEWLLILGGAISILLGAALVALPGPGALALLWWIATWAVVFGLILIVWSFRLRSLAR
jgi:uncharacterized membrane protein HdeD (DUF308 family)